MSEPLLIKQTVSDAEIVSTFKIAASAYMTAVSGRKTLSVQVGYYCTKAEAVGLHDCVQVIENNELENTKAPARPEALAKVNY